MGVNVDGEMGAYGFGVVWVNLHHAEAGRGWALPGYLDAGCLVTLVWLRS